MVRTIVVLASSGWANSPAAMDSGESRNRQALYALPSTSGGLIQMTDETSAPYILHQAVGMWTLTMLNLSILEILLECTRGTTLVDQERFRPSILRCPRTSRTIHPSKSSIIIDLVSKHCKVLGGRDDDSISEMLAVEDIISDGSTVDGSFRIVRPGGWAGYDSDFEKGGQGVKGVVVDVNAGKVSVEGVVVD
jgi:hypothetical protein